MSTEYCTVRLWRGINAGMLCLLAVLSGCKEDDQVSRGGAVDKPAADRPNVVLLTVESLRADHIGCYGYERDTSPNIDALAREGTRYTHAYSVTSWTLTSHASIFTGLYPSAHQVVGPKDRLGESYATLAEELQSCGYQTAGIVSGVYLDPKHNLQQGFEHYDIGPIREPGTPASKDITNGKMEEATVRFFREVRDEDRPFFLFGYYWDPHHHYIPPPPYDTMFVPPEAKAPERVEFAPFWKLGRHISEQELLHLVAQYDGEIRCTDEYLGRLWKLLKEEGLWDDTWIILTADHGEEFYDHGHNSHKTSLYVETLHVPLIIKPPAGSSPTVDERLVNLIDLYPTVLDAADCKRDQPYNGRSLLEPVTEEDRPLFFELKSIWTFTRKSTGESWQDVEQWTAVRKGDYKLIHVRDLVGKEAQRWELYNVAKDPAEQNPLTRKYEEVAGELQGEIDQWRDAMDTMSRLWTAGGEAQLSREEEQRLRSLGYLP